MSVSAPIFAKNREWMMARASASTSARNDAISSAVFPSITNKSGPAAGTLRWTCRCGAARC